VKSEKSRFIIHARRLRVNLGGEFTKITGLGAVLCRHFEKSRGFNAPQPESPTRVVVVVASSDLGIIIGADVGGVVMLALVGVVVMIMKKKGKKVAPTTNYATPA